MVGILKTKKENNMNKKLLTYLTLAALPFSASAATVTWDGAGDGTTYTNGPNWGGTAPADDLVTDIAQLTGGTVDLDTTRQVSGLDFSTGSTLSGIGSLEIGSGGINVGGNSYLQTTDVVLNQANTTITLDGGRLSTGSGTTISGTGALTVTGANTLWMDGGANTYAGGTTIENGAAVMIKNGDALGAGDISLDNGTFGNNSANVSIYNRNIDFGAGGGTLDANGGYISLRSSTYMTGSGTMTIADGGGNQVFMDADNSATFTGDIVIQSGGNLTAAANAVSLDSGTANLTLDGGTLQANGNINTQNRNLIVTENGGTINTGGKNVAMNDSTLSGTGALTINGGGTASVNTGGNTLSGGVTLDSVQMNLQTDGSDALGTGTITLDNGGTIKNSNNRPTVNNDVVLGSGGGSLIAGWSNKNMTFNGDISGDGALTIGNDSSAIVITGNNTYTGDTTIQGFTMVSGSLGTGTITLDDVDGSRGKIQNNDSNTVLDNNVVVSADNNGGRLKAGWSKNLTLNGVVSGAGALTIEGDSGTIVLGNAGNTYSGAINLQDANSKLSLASLGSGATISGDAEATLTLLGDIDLDTVNSFAGTTTVSSGAAVGGSGSLAGGLSLLTGADFLFTAGETLTVGGAVTIGDGFSISNVIGLDENTANATYTLIDNLGTIDYGNIAFGEANAVSIGGDKTAYFQEGSLQVVVIPEPATLGLVAVFGGAILVLRRRFMI
jgi:hypothetical protein